MYNSPAEVLATLVEALYKNRDMETVLSCVTDNIGWIGTENYEVAYGKEELCKILEQQKKKYPYALNFTYKIQKEIQTSEESVTLFAEGRHNAVEDKIGGFDVRASIDCILTKDGWRIQSIHVSTPNYIFEKSELEQKLEETRKQEHILLSAIPGGVAIYRLKKDGRFLTDYVSEGLAKLCGYDSISEFHEYLRKNPMVNVVEEEIPIIMDAAQKSLQTQENISVMYHIHVKNKPDILNRLDAKLMDVELGDDDVAVWYAVHTIVSEEALKIIQNQKKLQTLMDDVPAGIGIYEVVNGEIVQDYMNDAFYQMLGTTREKRSKYFGNNALRAAHPDDVLPVQHAIGKLLKGSNHEEATYRIEVEDKQWFWLHVTASVVERRENYIKMFANLADYNETMLAQQELEYHRTTMRIALSTAKVLTWRYDYKKNQVTDSLTLGEAFHLPKVFGDVAETVINLGFISEDSQTKFREMFQQIETETTVSLDVRANVENERGYAWYRMIYTPVFDKTGNYVDAIGVAIDITEQKERELRYEEQLRLSRKAAEGALAYASYNLTANTITNHISRNPEIYKIPDNGIADVALEDFQNVAYDAKEEEKLMWLRDTQSMIKAYKSGISHIAVRHRIKNLRGWMETTFDMIENPQTRDIEAIGFMRDITPLVRSELVVNQLLQIDYQSIFLVDIQKGQMLPFQQRKKDSILSEIVAMQESVGDMQEGLNIFLRKYAVPGTAEKAIKENSQECVRKKLETAPYYETTYSLILKEKKHSYRVIYAYLSHSTDILLCAIQDITDIYEQEEEQRAQLSVALEEAKAANVAKTAFLSRVSHDMRTPLNGILGLTTLLKDSVVDDNVLRDLTELEMSGKYLLNLINDTLDMGKIESGKLELHPRVCDGKTVFNNALGLAKAGIQAKNIQLHAHAENIPFTTLYIDVERIEQIVLNVLGNAVKFTPEGGQIDVFMTNLSAENGVITDKVVISDNGIGMSPEFLPHIFDAFTQEDATRTSAHQGTGLGMAITKQLVHLMGGDISVESEVGKGTSFTIILRMDVATPEQIEDAKKNYINSNSGIDLQGKRILLCEDHPLNTTIATRLLEAKGMIVEHAENGQIGVDMFEHSVSYYYDAVLMDIRMPVMDGIDAAKAIRSLPRRDARVIPIIAMTANAFDDDVRQTREAGMDDHLSKPIQREVLYQTLAELLKVDLQYRKQKILVVDDVEVNRAVIKSSLEDDYEIIEAENGKQAMELLKIVQGLDAVITDIQMPEMNGIELIKQIRSDDTYRHIKIIANTQFGDPEQEEELLLLGANDFVYKPTTPKIVEMRLRNVLRRM